MKFFFRTRKFRILVVTLCLVLAASLVVRLLAGLLSPGSGVLGMITAPFQQLFHGMADGIKDLQMTYSGGKELLEENDKLKEELSELREKTVTFEEMANQNEFYKSYLEIKEQNPDFKFADCQVIAHDPADPFGGFTVNKGLNAGIRAYDPVIVNNYLLGYVQSVGPTTCKVVTVFSPELTAGVNDSRTDDPGVITGTADLAAVGQLKLYNLPRSCQVAVGDYLVTSGEGIFPEGLLVGTVTAIHNDEYYSSVHASVTPFADFSDLRHVMILTDFAGQGSMQEAD